MSVATPELDKVRAVHERSQAIGNFIEWLQEKGIHLGKHHQHDDDCFSGGFRMCGYKQDELVRFHYSISGLLAEHFDIDLQKVEAEKMAILEAFREH